MLHVQIFKFYSNFLNFLEYFKIIPEALTVPIGEIPERLSTECRKKAERTHWEVGNEGPKEPLNRCVCVSVCVFQTATICITDGFFNVGESVDQTLNIWPTFINACIPHSQ